MTSSPIDDSAGSSTARIYVNDVAVGTVRSISNGSSSSTTATYTENITIEDGDRVQIYGYNSNASGNTGLTVQIWLMSTSEGVLNGYGYSY